MPPDSSSPSAVMSLVRLSLAVAYLAGLGWFLWQMLPADQRTACKLQHLRLSARVMTRLARHTGAASLNTEYLTGGRSRVYWLPYGLSVLRDRLTAAYENQVRP